MKDNVFIDTNLWIYLYSTDEKSLKIRNVIDINFDNIKISVQILGEIFHVLTKKGFKSKEDARKIVLNLRDDFKIIDLFQSSVIKAMDINVKHNYSYWDSLVISAALESNCTILYSEDMQHGKMIEGMKITNPFKL